ncbi:MAG: cytochrome c biogenesis protein [Akkermansiaceae bacterium]
MSESINLKKRSKLGRWIAFLLVLTMLGLYGLMTIRKNVNSDKPREISDYVAWEEQVVVSSRDIAFQDGGRVKPFSTWAGFSMLKLYGSRTMKITVNGEKVSLSPEEILLDALFRPEFASELPLFRIDNSDVISSLASSSIPEDIRQILGMTELVQKEVVDGVLEGKGKRDRYSYDELKPVIEILFSKASKIAEAQKEKSKMTAEQRRTTDLAQQINFFRTLIHFFDFARADVEVEEGTPSLEKENLERMSYWLKSLPVLGQAVREMHTEGEPLPAKLQSLFSELEIRFQSGYGLSIIPPYSTDKVNEEQEWSDIGDRLEKVVNGDLQYAEPLLADMYLLENTFIALREKGQADFSTNLTTWKKNVHERIDPEIVERLSSEVKYAQRHYFLNALVIFIITSLIVMVSWLSPGSKASRIMTWLAGALTIWAVSLMVMGIIHRSMIMERSPIGNLYDTILFIGTTGVLILLLVELLTRRMVALGLAVFIGMICMFLARRYEMGDAKDHMDPLVAVLKSNFWLSTHVVTVTMGYMGGLVTAGLSVIYIFARVLGIDEGDKDFRRFMTRIVYGMVCFTLFFSLIGTVLGGIWANDSWGRFWGWDPKENGALMIVLWSLAVLHARLAGFLREWGLHIAAVFGANIVAFSWWHVNGLGTGLHSYGFIEGIGAVWGFYYLMSGVCVIAGIAAFLTRRRPSARI